MASWADVEFRKTAKYRRVQNVVSLAADLLMLWDLLVSVASGETARWFWQAGTSAGAAVGDESATCLPEVVIGSLTLALALRSAAHFGSNARAPENGDSVTITYHVSRTVAVFIAVAFATQIGHRSAQIWIFGWLVAVACILVASRWGFANWLEKVKRSGALRETVAIVGNCDVRERLAVRIASEADIVGVYEMPSDPMRFLYPDAFGKLEEMGADGCLDSIVFAVEAEHPSDISQIVERWKVLPIELAICEEGERPQLATAEFRILAGVPIRVVTKRPISRRELLLKTVLDKIGAALLLITLLPVMALIAGSIKITSRGRVIFRQTRQGWCGQAFTVYKFRTMRDAPQTYARYLQTKRNDTRCTWVGMFLRRFSLDELPQLWNVLIGDMSLVGPRPHADMLDEHDRLGREVIAEYAQRYRVRPGMTGWAQINGARGATTTVEQLRRRVALDLYYIEHWSLGLDLRILARTPFCMTGKNAF